MDKNYSVEQVRRFQNRDKRIIAQSTLKALLGDKGLERKPEGWSPADIDNLLRTVFYVVEEITKEYPTDDDMSFEEKANLAGDPFTPAQDIKRETQEVGYPKHCPECGADVKQKSGISRKNGKPYSFVGCSAYPECKWILK